MKAGFQTLILITLIIIPSIVHAEEEYQMQVSVSQSHLEVGDEFEMDEHIVTANHYFSPIRTKGQPLAEAAFFVRIGQIRVLAGPGDIKDGPLDADRFSYGALVKFAKPLNPLTAQISYTTTETEFNVPILGGFSNERYGVAVGYFFLEDFLVSLELNRSETKRSLVGFENGAFKDQSYAIHMKWVEKLKNKKALNLEGTLALNYFDDPSQDGNNGILHLSGDYYLNRKFSIGLGAMINRGDEAFKEGETYFANILTFFNPYFSLGLFYEGFFSNHSGEDDRASYGTSLAARF